MLLATEYVGHRDDPDVAARLADADPLTVVLSGTDRRRSRVRTATVDGRDLGVVCARDLEDGDVLGTEDGALVLVELEGVETLVLDLGTGVLSPADALELGHALGNRHWDLALRGTDALFPVTTSRERVHAVVEEAVPEAVPRRYERVSPALFDGRANHTQTHGEDADHAHSHGDGHSHDDGHGHGDSHSHGDDPARAGTVDPPNGDGA
jgi:urease accessory protein